MFGNSLVDALTSKEVNLSHVKLILYSEELARSDLSGHINTLISNVDIRPQTSVAICRGKAEDFFKNVTPVLETSPARYYDLILSSFNYTSESAGTELIDFYTSAQSIDREATAVIAEIKDNESKNMQNSQSGSNNIQGKSDSQSNAGGSNTNSESNNEKKEAKFAGLAVFKGSKMVGEISPLLTMGHLIMTNKLQDAAITVPDVGDKNKLASITVRQNKPCKFDVKIENNIPKIKINVYLDAHLESSGTTTDYLDNDNKYKLNKAVEEKITQIVNDYLNKLIECDSDIAGIGREAKLLCTTWKEFEELNWKEIFKNAEFDVSSSVSLNVSQIIFHRIPNQ